MTNTNPIKFYDEKGDKKNIITNTREASYQELCDAVYEELIIRFEKEWRNRFVGYAKEINKNYAKREECREKYVELLKGTSLEIYTSINDAKNSLSKFNVRFQGESIGDFTYTRGKIYFKFDSTKRQKTNDERYNVAQFEKDGKTVLDAYNIKHTVEKNVFEIDVPSQEFNILCNFFSEKDVDKIARVFDKSANESQNNEHKFESAILTALEGDLVLLNNARFQMHTPLGASTVITKNYVKYSGRYGKGPDILTKTENTLNVIELKDEPKSSRSVAAEIPEGAIKQAICYSVFLNTLLNGTNVTGDIPEYAKLWREIFGFDIKGIVQTNAIISMPKSKNDNLKFVDNQLTLKNGSTIMLKAALFDEKRIDDIEYMKKVFEKT